MVMKMMRRPIVILHLYFVKDLIYIVSTVTSFC
jgi:hypothetical protein